MQRTVIRDVKNSGTANGDIDMVIKEPDTPSTSLKSVISLKNNAGSPKSGTASSSINKGL